MKTQLPTACTKTRIHPAPTAKSLGDHPVASETQTKWPLCGFSPMIALTRSARRSNPQRMSVASLAIQIRAPCARSIACKLGTQSSCCLCHREQRPHTLCVESSSHHQAPAILQSELHTRESPAVCGPGLRHLALPGIAPSRFPVAVFSKQKSSRRATRVRGKTTPHSAPYALAPGSAFATSSVSAL
jgi:hypothetical protein